MDAAVRFMMPVGLARYADRPTSYAPFVKVTYKLEASGWASFAPEQAPITEGEVDRGVVLFPSDFAAGKRGCEVALVGRSLARHASPLRVTVGQLVLEAERPRALGAVAVGGGAAHFAADRARMPFPAMPLYIVVEGLGPTLRSGIRPPGAGLALVVGGAWSSPQRLATVVDTVLIDVDKRVASVIYRGFFQHPGDVDRDVVLVVEPAGALDERAAAEMAWWPRARVVTPMPAAAHHDEDAEGTLETDRPPPPASGDAPVVTAIPPAPRPAFPAHARDDETTHTIDRKQLLGGASDASDASDEGDTSDAEPLTPRPLQRETTATFAAPPAHGSVPGTPFVRQRAVVMPPKSAKPLQPMGGATMPMPARPFAAKTLPFGGESELVDEPSVAPTFGPRPVPPPKPSSPRLDREESTGIIQMPVRPALPFERTSAEPSAAKPPAAAPRAEPEAPKQADTAPPPTDAEPARHTLPPPPSADADHERGHTLPPPPPSAEHERGHTLPPPPSADAAHERGHTLPPPPSADADHERGHTLPPPPPIAAPLGHGRDPEEHTAQFHIPAAPRAALPFGHEIAPPERAVPLAAANLEVPRAAPLAPPEPWRPQPSARVAAPLVDTTPMLSLEDYAKVRGEIWSGLRPRREILRSHGLSELKWRAVERKWAAKIDAMASDPDKLMPVVSTLAGSATLAS